MNLYHKALLCWSFQRDFDLSKIDSWIGTCRFIIMTCQKQPLPLLQAHEISVLAGCTSFSLFSWSKSPNPTPNM